MFADLSRLRLPYRTRQVFLKFCCANPELSWLSAPPVSLLLPQGAEQAAGLREGNPRLSPEGKSVAVPALDTLGRSNPLGAMWERAALLLPKELPCFHCFMK